MAPIHCSLTFHPVGQGLFSSGCIRPWHEQPQFRWVYDCGTVSRKSLLTEAIGKLNWAPAGPRPKLDLVIISHFDRDHVNGLLTLLDTFDVGTLLLPYAHLWERLLIAFGRGVTAGRLLEFYLHPLAFLSREYQGRIDQLAWVPSSSGDENQASPLEPEPTFEGQPPSPLHIDVERGDNRDDSEGISKDMPQRGDGKPIPAVVLRRGGRLVASNAWEFVPYNEPPKKRVPRRFQSAVDKHRNLLLSGNAKIKLQSLSCLKALYDRQFGTSSAHRNVISLFVYCGPLSRRTLCHSTSCTHVCHAKQTRVFCHGRSSNRCGILYTGDGFLDTRARLTRMRTFFGDDRIGRVFCMQVMHHGARSNWHEGMADTIQPAVSVFSADPDRRSTRHPHAQVLKDFMNYTPCIADKETKVEIEMRCWCDV